MNILFTKEFRKIKFERVRFTTNQKNPLFPYEILKHKEQNTNTIVLPIVSMVRKLVSCTLENGLLRTIFESERSERRLEHLLQQKLSPYSNQEM
jgi:hypothetical protein